MKDLKRIFLIVVFALGAINIQAQDNSAAITAYNEALELAQSKDFDAAIEKYREAISIAEGLGADGEDIKNRSESAIPKLYFSKAVNAYNAFKSTPSIPNLDAAIAEFTQARTIGADSGDDQVRDRARGVLAQLHYQKATMLFKREDFAGTDEALNNAIEVNANYAKAYYQKGLVHKKTNPDDLEGIMNWFDRAIAVGEQVNDGGVVRQATESAHAELLFRGAKSIEQGQTTRAIELLQMSLEYDNESADSYYRLAEASNKLGNRDNAIRYANQALTHEPGGNTDKAKIYFELGLAYQAKNDKGNACDALGKASYGSFRAPAEHKMEFELKCESAR
ncbi:MAG: tetratricopeptide repeat protein [Balneola sp.]